MESSPANTSSVEALSTQIVQVVDWFSPTNDLVTGQWNHLDIFWSLSWFDLLGPKAFSLTFLDIAMLN